LERAFTFVYFAEKSEIARGLQSESWVRALRSGCVDSFFRFYRGTIDGISTIMLEHRETIVKQCGQPLTDNALLMKINSVSIFIHIFLNALWKIKLHHH